MGHVGTLYVAASYGLQALYYLILVAGDLRRTHERAAQPVVGVVNAGALRIVDVVDNDVAPVAANYAMTRAGAMYVGLQHGHASVGISQRNAVLGVDASRRLDARRVNLHDIGAERHVGEVEGVDAKIEQRPAAKLGPHDALLMGHGIAEAGHKRHRRTYAAVAYEAADSLRERHVARPYGLGYEHAALPGHAKQLFRLGSVGRKGFLTEHGTAVADAQTGVLIVHGVWSSHVDKVYHRVGRQLIIRAVSTADAVVAGEGRGLINTARGHGIGLNAVHAMKRGRHLAGDAPRPEYSYLICLSHNNMFFYTFNAVKVRKNIFIFAVILTNFIITMAMSKVEYHPNYDRYVEMITAHPNYNGLYYERKQDGRVKWVVASKSKNWLKRLAWWDDVCRRLGITIQKDCYAKAARAIHPTGKHVCQCCGKEKSIFYEYPTRPTLKRLNMAFYLELEQTDYTISEFVTKFCKTRDSWTKWRKY